MRLSTIIRGTLDTGVTVVTTRGKVEIMSKRRKSGSRYVITRYAGGRVVETLGSFYYRPDAERLCPVGFVVVAR